VPKSYSISSSSDPAGLQGDAEFLEGGNFPGLGDDMDYCGERRVGSKGSVSLQREKTSITGAAAALRKGNGLHGEPKKRLKKNS